MLPSLKLLLRFLLLSSHYARQAAHMLSDLETRGGSYGLQTQPYVKLACGGRSASRAEKFAMSVLLFTLAGAA